MIINWQGIYENVGSLSPWNGLAAYAIITADNPVSTIRAIGGTRAVEALEGTKAIQSLAGTKKISARVN